MNVPKRDPLFEESEFSFARQDVNVRWIVERGSWRIEVHFCHDFVIEDETVPGRGWIWTLETRYGEWVVECRAATCLADARRDAMGVLAGALRGEWDEALALTKAKVRDGRSTPARLDHDELLRSAVELTRRALQSASSRGFRQDCLREAVRALEGAQRGSNFDRSAERGKGS